MGARAALTVFEGQCAGERLTPVNDGFASGFKPVLAGTCEEGDVMRLVIMLAIHALAMTVLIGIGITAVLVDGMVNTGAILTAAGAGFVLALPVTWLVTRQILSNAARA